MGVPLDRLALREASVVDLAVAMLGVEIHSFVEGVHTAGRIVETEAYQGADDRASHSYQNRRTPRTEVFFGDAGHAYVYLVYGIHTMFNVVVGPVDRADAILIRAIQPFIGVPIMKTRRADNGHLSVNKRTPRSHEIAEERLANGPGLVCQALGIKRAHYGLDLLDFSSPLRLEGQLSTLLPAAISATPRVGVQYSGACAARPWRFRESESRFTSPAK